MTLRNEDITSTKNDSGESIIEFDMDSNCFPVEQPDTYSTYTGDSYTESELEWLAEDGKPSDYDSYSWDYNVAAVVEALGKAGAADIEHQLKAEGIILDVTVISAYSPRYYNYGTDSYKATYRINATKLDAWCVENKFDADAYAKEHHGSYSGFMSFVDGWLADPARRDPTIQWLKVDAYLRAELDLQENQNAMAEAADMAWCENTIYTLQEPEDCAGA